MKRIIVLLMICLLSFPEISFEQTGISLLEKNIRDELEGLSLGGNKVNRYNFDSTNEKHFFNLLQTYENSPVEMVQIRVLMLMYTIAFGSNDSKVRQSVVFEFLNSLDKSSAVSQFVINRLGDFKEKDFSNESKILIQQKFQRFQTNNGFILVCGIAQIKNLSSELIKISFNFNRYEYGWVGKQAWFARLALARMGNYKSIDSLITAVELFQEKGFKVTKLFKDIAYTQHPDALRLLLIYLKSKDTISSSKEGIEMPVNVYAMEYLAKYIENFPVKLKNLGYTPDEIKLGIAYLENILGS